MRHVLILLATTALAACSGGGPATVGGTAAPAAPGAGGAAVTPSSGHTFVAPTEQRTYNAIGGIQHYQYTTNDTGADTQYRQLYSGDASTTRNSGITVNYNPRDAIFEIVLNQPLANVSQNLRFQDPAHRTAFGGASQPQDGNPDVAGASLAYLETGGGQGAIVYGPQSNVFPIGAAASSVERRTFFYQRPGTTTNYVTYAGFVRNATSVVEVTTPGAPTYLEQNHVLERGAFVYGERSEAGVVPTTGSGTFNGQMLATMVYNPLFDTDPTAPTYFQWIAGTSLTTVNFAANSFTVDLTGTVYAPQFDIFTTRQFTILPNATFAAAASGRVDVAGTGGFVGQFGSASFTQPGGQVVPVNVAGSSLDGAFFGPQAQEVGGGFRIVGGTPDQRVDIMGAFTGKRP